MSRSDFWTLLGAVWLAPLNPGIGNVLIGTFLTIAAIYYFYKEK